MPTIPCISKIDSCLPCDDEPILNISAEAADVDRYISRFAFLNPFPPIRQYPDFDDQGGGIFLQIGCMRWCWSTISQDDADDCARRQAMECAFNPLIPNIPTPDEFHPNRIAIYTNQAVTGTYACPDGNLFSYTIAANTIAALTPGTANAIAFALAKQRAKEHRVCISNLDDPICVDTWATKQITSSGPYVAVFPATDRWELVSGTVPDGMTLETGFTSDGISLSGIPTTIGEYQFRVRCTISTFGSPGYGDFMEKVFTVKIVGITEASPLPDATLGTAYSQQLHASGSTLPEGELWSITSGTLPDGLSLSPQGLIEGTPSGPLAGYSFTVQAQFPVGNTTAVCSKQFSITTKSGPILSYWTLDENDPTGFGFVSRVDSVHGINLAPFNVTPSVAGKVSLGIRLFSTSNPTTGKILETPITSVLAYTGYDITLAAWVKIDDKDTSAADQYLLCYELEASSVGGVLGRFALSYNPLSDDFLARLEGSGVTDLLAGATVVAGTWYLVQCIYHASTGFTSIRVDNNAMVNGASGEILPVSGFGKFFIQQFPCDGPLMDIKVDECGAWLRELTTAELDSLWNSGSGISWPTVPM